MVISTEVMDGKLFGINNNVSVAVFQHKPRMVTVEFGSIVLSSKVIFCREGLLDAHEHKLNFAFPFV